MRSIWILMLLLLVPLAEGAVIHGTVYDFSLQKAGNVVVEINTVPEQRDVTEGGMYSFNVEAGEYVLRAEQLEDGMLVGMAEETVKVTKEGAFVVDIILFPELDQPLNLPEIDEQELTPLEEVGVGYLVWFIAIIVALFVVCYILRRSHREVKIAGTETDALVSFLKRHGGRATQKEIRKEFPQSEAKISLLLTELEDAGVVKKIKKGRGNIIVLK